MNINSKIYPDYVVLQLEGNLSVENLTPFEESLSTFYGEGKHIIIDLSGVLFMDSSSLGVIILYFTKCEKNKKKFVLVNINRDIYDMFTITGFARRFTIFQTLAEATAFIEK